MTKKNKTVIGIFGEAIKLYFSNFNQFFKYMTFPVFGQIIGLYLTLLCTYIYAKHLPALIEHYKIFNNFNTLVLLSVLVALPGMVIFIKAFWEYLVAYGAINSMLDNMLKSGRVYDFRAHTELIKRRTASFVILWMIVGTYTLLAFIPLLWIPAGVIAIYLVLVFQIFTYESKLSAIECFKRSFNLIKGHFSSTFLLVFLLGIITWILIPNAFNHVFSIAGINNYISKLFIPFVSILPLDEFNSMLGKILTSPLKSSEIAMFITTTTVSQILIQYTLPLRTLACGLWYKNLNTDTQSYQSTHKRNSSKRPSEKLMEETNKKYSKKKIDKNILRRAMEKDDEQN